MSEQVSSHSMPLIHLIKCAIKFSAKIIGKINEIYKADLIWWYQKITIYLQGMRCLTGNKLMLFFKLNIIISIHVCFVLHFDIEITISNGTLRLKLRIWKELHCKEWCHSIGHQFLEYVLSTQLHVLFLIFLFWFCVRDGHGSYGQGPLLLT